MQFHVYDISRTGKSIEMKGLKLTRVRAEMEWGVPIYWVQVFFWRDESILELNRSKWYSHILSVYFKMVNFLNVNFTQDPQM